MSTNIIINLRADHAAEFQPIQALPKYCQHRIPYAACSQLRDRAAKHRILCQSAAGWQFDLWLYQSDSLVSTRISACISEGRVYFLYALNGTFRFEGTETDQPTSLEQGYCTPIYLPPGQYPVQLIGDQRAVFGFSMSYGYLMWFVQHHPALAPLARHWKAEPHLPFALPARKMDKDTWRTFVQLKSCPKRGSELDGALKIYIARFLALYADQLAAEDRVSQTVNEALIDRITTYLEEHFAAPSLITTEILHDRFSASISHIRRQFLLIHRHTISEHVQDLRVEAGKKLLITTNLPIQEIAQCVGYEFSASFVNVFSKRIGMPPATYRWKYRR